MVVSWYVCTFSLPTMQVGLKVKRGVIPYDESTMTNIVCFSLFSYSGQTDVSRNVYMNVM